MALKTDIIRALVYANTGVVESPTDDSKVDGKIVEVYYLSQPYITPLVNPTGDILDEDNYSPLQQQFLAYYAVWLLECDFVSEQAASVTTGDPDIFVKKVKADVVEKEWGVKSGSSSSSSSSLGANSLKKLCASALALGLTTFPPCKSCSTTTTGSGSNTVDYTDNYGLGGCAMSFPALPDDC